MLKTLLSRRILIPLLLIIFLLIIHVTYLSNGFVWLDHGDIENGRSIVRLTDIKSMLFRPYGATTFYRPMVTFFHSLDFAIFKLNPVGYHLTNILIFLAIPYLSVLFLSCYFKLRDSEKLFIILLIGLHPLSWLPKGAISYRPELLFVLFAELALITHVKYRKTDNILLRYASIFFILCSLFSKETALIMVPFCILLWELKNRNIVRRGQLILFYVEEGLSFFLYIVLRVSAVHTLWPQLGLHLNFSEAIGTRIGAVSELIRMIFSPFLPRLSDSIRVMPIVSRETAFFVALSFGILVLLRIFSKDKNLLQAFALFAVSLLPALNILPLPRFISPHYAFFSMIISASIIVILLRNIRGNFKTLFIILLCLIVGIMAGTTFQGGRRFKNDFSLFYPEVKNDKNFLEGHFYLGDYFFTKKDINKADIEYTKALNTNGKIIAYVDRSAAILKLANVKRIEKKYEEAAILLQKVSSDPNPYVHHAAIYDQAVIAYEMGDYEKTIAILKSAGALLESDRNSIDLLNSAMKLGHFAKF